MILSDMKLYYLDFSRRAESGYILREEFSGLDLMDATRRGLELIPELEKKYGAMDRLVIHGSLLNGDMVVWKLLQDGVIARLLVPEAARRIAIGYDWRQLKCEYVKVLSVRNSRGREIREGVSMADPNLIFRIGETVYPDSYTHEVRKEPSPGIYCYFSEMQAREHGEPGLRKSIINKIKII